MSGKVVIPDYGVGNLFSIARAIEKVGGEPILAVNPKAIVSADRLILPGVGAFASCINALQESGFAGPVVDFVATGRPFLGICVGMQLLFDYSLEFGRHDGLGLIPGHVDRILVRDDNGVRRVPHIGWSPLNLPVGRESWEGTLFEGAVTGRTAMYFVHSYNCLPYDPSIVVAEADYEGWSICASIERDNVAAIQCHPERSGPSGLRFFENFLAR